MSSLCFAMESISDAKRNKNDTSLSDAWKNFDSKQQQLTKRLSKKVHPMITIEYDEQTNNSVEINFEKDDNLATNQNKETLLLVYKKEDSDDWNISFVEQYESPQKDLTSSIVVENEKMNNLLSVLDNKIKYRNDDTNFDSFCYYVEDSAQPMEKNKIAKCLQLLIQPLQLKILKYWKNYQKKISTPEGKLKLICSPCIFITSRLDLICFILWVLYASNLKMLCPPSSHSSTEMEHCRRNGLNVTGILTIIFFIFRLMKMVVKEQTRHMLEPSDRMNNTI
jgi:hypothetical protein